MIFPDAVGGLEIHAYRVAQRLVRLGMPVVVLTRFQKPHLPAREVVGEVAFVRIRPVGLLKGLGWRAAGPIARLLASVTGWLLGHRREFDVVLVHGIKVLSWPAVALSRLGVLPCVIKVESPMEIWEEISAESLRRMGLSGASRTSGALRGARAFVLRRADRLIAISSEIFDGLVQMGVPADRIVRIPNGVDTELFHPVDAAERSRLRARLGLPADALVVNYTGRLSRAKGLPVLLEVWRQLVAGGRPAHLALVGSGAHSFDDCEAELRAFIARHRLDRTVTMPGTVGNPEEWMQAADIFVFPSEYEGLPLAVLEAMACGLPVIATSVGAIPDVVQDKTNGLLVTPKQPGDLRAALGWLFEDAERRVVLGVAARKTVLERYSLDAIAGQYAAALAEVGAAAKRRRG